MVVVAVEERDANRSVRERTCRVEAAEARPEDDDVRHIDGVSYAL
jgi:hypothetical protein